MGGRRAAVGEAPRAYRQGIDQHQRWPGAQVELVPIRDLIPDSKNARTHDAAQIEVIASLMLSHGFTNPILRDEKNGVLAGHGRLLAAALLVSRGEGAFELVPCITARGWTEQQKRAYILADNQTALKAGWDMTLLQGELRQLSEWGSDLKSLGFGIADLRSILGHGGKADPEAAPPAPTTPKSKPGDLYLMGDHRVLCGDSTSATDVARLLGDTKPHLMVTDPPYGVNYDAAWRNRAMRKDGSPIAGRAVGKVSNDDRADWTPTWALFPGDVAYIWHGALHAATVQASLESVGLQMRTQIIWNKTAFVISRGDYHYRHEPCWYAVRKGKPGRWAGDRSQNTVWDINHRKSETGHSTQKPIECMRRPIVNNSAIGDPVYDPFLGSGTTLIAAEMEGRKCFGLEIDPAYCDVIVERWQKFTGKTAVLA